MKPLMRKITREVVRRAHEMGEDQLRKVRHDDRDDPKNAKEAAHLARAVVTELIDHIKSLDAPSEEHEKAREEMLSHLYECLDDGLPGVDDV